MFRNTLRMGRFLVFSFLMAAAIVAPAGFSALGTACAAGKATAGPAIVQAELAAPAEANQGTNAERATSAELR